MTFKQPKVFEPVFDKELLGHEDKEIMAIPSKGECVYDNGNGTVVQCVYSVNDLCPSRSCGPDSVNNQPAVMYVSKLAYMSAKLTSL